MDHAENPHVFITGDEDDDRRGTSLYCVYLRRGLTIRCSGANDGDRVATTFIRHYNIVFLNGRRRAHEEPREGDIPVEGDYRIARLLDIAEGERDGHVHRGHPIIRMLHVDDLNPRIRRGAPREWVGGHRGTSWEDAVAHVLAAINFVDINPVGKYEEEVASFIRNRRDRFRNERRDWRV